MDGPTAIAAIKAMLPALPIVALTTFSESTLVLDAIRAGADGSRSRTWRSKSSPIPSVSSAAVSPISIPRRRSIS